MTKIRDNNFFPNGSITDAKTNKYFKTREYITEKESKAVLREVRNIIIIMEIK